jgi:hypothetical protein
MFDDDPDIHLLALIAEERQVRDRAAAAQDVGEQALADYLHARAD